MKKSEPLSQAWEICVERGDQLAAVEKIGRESIGDAHPSAATLAERLAINPEVLQVFARRDSRNQSELCGYLLLYPLTDAAGTAIAEGRIRSGRELGPETLLPSFGGARYLYVGMVLGTPDAAARSHAKARLRKELSRRLDRGDVKLVFGRPATSPGRRLLRTYGFLPIADENDIWAASGQSLRRTLRASSEPS